MINFVDYLQKTMTVILESILKIYTNTIISIVQINDKLQIN